MELLTNENLPPQLADLLTEARTIVSADTGFGALLGAGVELGALAWVVSPWSKTSWAGQSPEILFP